MHILLLSAYDTDSHKSWCQGLMNQLSQHQWHYLTLPGRHFSWRIRGNGLSFAFGDQAHLLQQTYDLIIATSMVDLATVKGLCPKLASTPSILYFHENQFAYPKSHAQHSSIEPQMVNLYAALCADKVVFNSEFNRQSFLEGATSLLKKLPDHAPLSAIESIKNKSQVLPVPIHCPTNKQTTLKKGEPLKVIWNHRWEYDKGPDTLANCIKLAAQGNLNIEFTVCGMSFRNWPDVFIQLNEHKPSNLLHLGTFESKQEYLDQLSQHHVVLSTAIHEFQGLAMLEGAALGCSPLAPNRLAYPEWIPSSNLYNQGSSKDEAKNICNTLKLWLENGIPKTPDVSAYQWVNMKWDYEQLIMF